VRVSSTKDSVLNPLNRSQKPVAISKSPIGVSNNQSFTVRLKLGKEVGARSGNPTERRCREAGAGSAGCSGLCPGEGADRAIKLLGGANELGDCPVGASEPFGNRCVGKTTIDVKLGCQT
jgi:hypothetical protein